MPVLEASGHLGAEARDCRSLAHLGAPDGGHDWEELRSLCEFDLAVIS